MHRLFTAIYIYVNRNKLSGAAAALVFLAIFGYFASCISFEEDITRLIPRNERTDETAKVLEQLNFSDKITVIINAGNGAAPEELAAAATVFLDSLQAAGDYVEGVQGKMDDEGLQETFDFVYNNLPVFLGEEDYSIIAQKLHKDSIAAAVAANYRNIIAPSGIVTKDFILKDPFGISFLALNKLRQLGLSEDFHLQDGFILTKDKSKLLLFISPALPANETRQNALFVDKLYNIKKEIDKVHNVNVEYFGATVIAVANAKQIKSDIKITAFIAVSALMLIFMVYYRKIYIPAIILLPSLFGVVFAVAALYFIKGTISAISLGIGSVLIGVTIDYALHILTHYKHTSDIRALYKDITRPLIMSSTTTAVAFLCLLFVKSEALKDLGIFAAVSVVASSVFSLLIIPHLYRPTGSPADNNTVIDRFARFSFHSSRPLIIVSIAVIIASLFFFNSVQFDSDISQLNFIPDEVKKAEKSLESATNLTSKSLYLASYGESADEVLHNNKKLSEQLQEAKGSNRLLGYNSVAGVALSAKEQQERIGRWNSFWTPERKKEVKAALVQSGVKHGFRETAYTPFYELLERQPGIVSVQEYLSVKSLHLNEFITVKDGFYTVSTLVKINEAQRDGLVSELSAQPKLMVIDRQQVNEAFLGGLRDDFISLINYSFLAVIAILFLFFRRIELVLISCIPIVVTGLVTAGIMGMFDIRLNIFSTIVCTLVFGHGVDFSIFMTSALQKEYTYGRNEMASYRTSILLAVITTVLGIGALIFAGHPALKSISSVSLIGVIAALIITFVFYPILFRFFFTARTKNGKSPLQLRKLLHSLISFTYYGLGGFLLSIFSLLFINLFPAGKKWKMEVFRYAMSKFMKSVLYTNHFIHKKVWIPHGEDFKKPAVIIANHTSFLDILAIGMLSPKIIYLVSDWVYNSPIFGIGVKLAGFYPVSEGLEGGVGHLREKVEQGYSLVIFPEGTRSVDNTIRRFHKGAFYLAEEFGLDILPIVIHGNSEVLPKGDFILNGGSLTVNILERIAPGDKRFGNGYAERTKLMSRYFKDEFRKMRDTIEGPLYFRNKVIQSFTYKERDIVQQVKQSISKNAEVYYRLGRHIGSKAVIAHIADDYGQADILLALQEPARRIYSYIEDDSRRDVARTNYIVRKRAITYTGSPFETGGKTPDIALISAHSIPRGNNSVPGNIKLVILAGSTIFMPAGFETAHEEDGFRILRRIDCEEKI